MGLRNCLATLLGGSDRQEIQALRARLDALEAKEAIRDIFNRYAFTADTGDSRGWSELWAEDCVYEPQNYVRRGRAEMYAANSDPQGVHKKDIEGQGSLHTTSPVMIRQQGDRAWAEGSSIVWIKTDDGYRPTHMSYSHWDLVRRDGRWQIKYRKTRPVAPGNAGEVWKAWRGAD